MEFYLIYIREAHASDAWQLKINEKENVVYEEPQDYDERTSLAGVCSTNLGIEFPALVDTMEDTTESAYTAWPERLYVIDSSGRIAYKSEAGPFGFRPEQLSEAIAQLVGSPN